ncbi:hypothetical protein GCM10009092_38790 [Bowmanella denitrificans]|uniref:PEP-CTERM protein-sorting domain-containing protein n=1 Tax=Bowmanella denitrificans TaxID=366582 RepID=A0ABN0XRG1_9ALTE
MNLLRLIMLLGILASPQSLAALINNGDFASCDLSGWQTDTDGASGGANDFSIEGSAPNCSAGIHVDAANTDVFFANTLYQALDFTGMGLLKLSLDFSVDSELTSQDNGFVADYFAIGLGDGSGALFDQFGLPGSLSLPTDINGAADFSLSWLIDASLLSQPNWTLEFQVLVGADSNGFTDLGRSSLLVHQVSLEALSNQVPEPVSLILMLAGLLLLGRTLNNHQGARQ